MDILRLDGAGRIVEHRDALLVLPETSAHGNGMFRRRPCGRGRPDGFFRPPQTFCCRSVSRGPAPAGEREASADSATVRFDNRVRFFQQIYFDQMISMEEDCIYNSHGVAGRNRVDAYFVYRLIPSMKSALFAANVRDDGPELSARRTRTRDSMPAATIDQVEGLR